MNTMQNAIEIKDLHKTYAAQGKAEPKVALSGIDLNIPKGSMYALLGPNGAGKSTLINIMAGLVTKTAGLMKINDIDIDQAHLKAKRHIGIVPQELNIDPFFTPREALELQAGLYGVPKSQRRTMDILSMLGLADKADAYARTLSGGMRRRLMVAKAMVHDPDILILDEPTAGVDIELRQQLWTQVRKLNEAGKTILLTTHYLEEAQELCDYIAIINHGKLVVSDRKDNLLGTLNKKTLKIKLAEPLDDVPGPLKQYNPTIDKNMLCIVYKPQSTNITTILLDVQNSGLEIQDISTEEADLEDIFLDFVRR